MKRYIENTVDLRPISGARIRQPDDKSGEIIGKAITGFGQDLGVVHKNLDEIAQKYDEAAVRRADAEDALEISKIKQRALASKGIDAQSAVETANTEIDAIAARRQESFSSSRQRDMYSDVFSRRKLGVQEALGEHSTKQVEVAYQASLDASIETSSTLAVDNHNDPVEFQRNMTALESAARSKLKGMPEDVIQNKLVGVRSSVHTSVVEKLLADPETVADAGIYLKDHAADILPEAETKLWKAINPVLEEEEDASILARIASGANPGTGADIDDDTDPLAPAPEGPTVASGKAETGFVSPLGPKYKTVRSGIGKRDAPTAGASTNHNGLDIPAPEGTPIRPPMHGKVIANFFSEGGGWQVRVQHPNGKVTGYAHMRSQSPLEVGSEVEKTTILGGVGSTGRSTGNHLHYVVRNARGEVEDGRNVDWEGGVNPRGVNWKPDKNNYAEYQAEDTDVGTQLKRLREFAQTEGWSQRKYERLVTQVRQRGAVNQQLYNKAQADQMDAAAAVIADADLNGTPLTMRSQVPGYSKLDAAGRARIDTALAANKKALAGEGPEDGDDTYLDLLEASATDQKAFAQVDLRLIPLSKGDRRRLLGIQSKIRGKEGEPTNFAASHSRVYTMIDRFAGSRNSGAGYVTGREASESDKRRQTILFDEVNRRATARQIELKRELTDDELQGIVRSQTVAMTREGTTAPRYIMERTPNKNRAATSVEVPKDQVVAIIQAYRAANGGAMPTGAQIRARYLQYLAMGGR